MRNFFLRIYFYTQYVEIFFFESKTSNADRLAELDRTRILRRMILRAIAQTGSFTHYVYRVLLPRLGSSLGASHHRTSDLRGHGWPVLALTAVRERESKQQIEATAAGKALRCIELSLSLDANRNRNPSSRLMNSGSISTLTRRLVHSHCRLTAPVASPFSPRPTLRIA